ncbi:MAG: hypothetical protein JW768_08870 [Chitinispirillaceae bacterium]|nr:hypothetical protein [Chitinispirillaceae bacterium]
MCIKYGIVYISLAILLCFQAIIQAYATRNAIILVIDGSRYSETFGDSTHQYIPRLWNDLRPQGTLYTRFYNDSLTCTVPGHASIISGVYQNIPNDGTVRPYSPTLFEYFRKEQGGGDSLHYVILGKAKLYMLTSSSHPEYGSAYGGAVIHAPAPFDDTATWHNIDTVLIRYHPRLAIINLAQVDVWGHTGIWEEYVRSIRIADSITAMVWDLIQDDPLYRDRTTLFVTNDHGRHDGDAWPDHGCGCDGCRHLLLLALGPDFAAGAVDTMRRSMIDLAPTIGELMDFSTPFCSGTPLFPVRSPVTPALMTPEDNARFQPLELSLCWKPVTRVTYYRVQVGTCSTFASVRIDDSMLTRNSRAIGPLDLNTVYFWRVAAKNSGGASSWSAAWRFTTIRTLPPRVTLVYPENAAVLSENRVAFSWSTSWSGVDYYCLIVTTDAAMKRVAYQDSTVQGTSAECRNLRNKTTFWWRVKAHTEAGWADWSDSQQFTVDFPAITTPPDRFSFEIKGKSVPPARIVLRYSIPLATTVVARLYSVKGQLIRRLVDGTHAPDRYVLSIPVGNLPVGYYLIDFKAAHFRTIKELALY